MRLHPLFSLYTSKSFSSPTSESTQGTDPGTLSRYLRENQQLRRELEDAHYRINQLEASLQRGMFPKRCDDDDDESVEVQSMDNGISVTSSTTTIPTGSDAANRHRAQQQWERDERRREKKARTTKRRGHKLRNHPAKAHVLLGNYSDPYGELLRSRSRTMLSSVEEDVPDDCSLPFLMSSGSVSSCSDMSSSGISERSGAVSSSDVSRAKSLLNVKNPVAVSAMGYLARIASSDSEISSKTNGTGYMEI